MGLLDDPLALALGTANANSISTAVVVANPIPEGGLDNDQEHARLQLLDVLENTATAIADLMKISKASQHPRAYEVLEKLLMRQQDAATKLLELHNARADINKKNRDAGGPQNPQNLNIANAVFVGTTSEFLDKLRGKDRTVEDHEDLLDAEYEEVPSLPNNKD